MSWPYLESELFQSRYVLAAHFLRDIPLVIELGGYKTPITSFLGSGQVGVSIDPHLEEDVAGRHYHLKGSYPNVEFPINGTYGVVILGLELHLAEDGWRCLYELLRGAERIVIGEPIRFPTSGEQIQKILKNVPLKKIMALTLDMTGNEEAVGECLYGERRLHVFEPC